MFIDFMSWWKEQMLDLLPKSLHLFGRTWQRVLVAAVEAPDASAVELFLQGRGCKTSLGRFGLSGTALQEAVARLPKAQRKSSVLQVPASLLLERSTILPLSAEQDLKRVVGYEMDRLTPFRADEVLWTCSAEKRDTARKQLHARVTIVPIVRVQAILAALRQAGLFPARIEAEGAITPCLGIPLGQGRPDHAWLGARLDRCALGGCGMLAVAAVAMPFILQSVALARLDTQIEALRPPVVEAEILRKKIASRATTADAIATARNQVGTALQAIALLTDVLPDDTFLTLLNARQRKLTISGRSATAARLIGAMAAHPLIQNPAFTASVIRDETSGGEMFSIRLDIGT